MPIRIMHVVNNLGKGGLENGLVNLIQRLDPDRFQHVVCTVRGLGANLERLPQSRVQVLQLDTTGLGDRVQTPALVRAIRTAQPDIVHSRNWSGIEAVFAARLAGVGGILHSEHGFDADAWAPEPRRRTLIRRTAFELAHRVLSVSRQLRDVHAQRTGFRKSRISVIHNGVDCVTFSPDADRRHRLRTELGIRESDLCIGCVANLLPVKDHMTLLEATTILASRTTDWRLVLVGEGPERATLQSFVDARPDLRSRVQLLGTSSRVPDVLRAMDVFVLPSLAEGMCNSLLEAMASGVTVIATAVGGNPEVIVDGQSGLLFKPGDVSALADHLSRLQVQPEVRSAFAASGLQRMQREFSIDSMVRSYEQLYRSLGTAPRTSAFSPEYH